MATSAPPAVFQRLGVTSSHNRSGTWPPLGNSNVYRGQDPPLHLIGQGARLSCRYGSDIGESGLEAWQPSWGPAPLHVRRRSCLESRGLVGPITRGGRGFSLLGLPGSRDYHLPLPQLQLSIRPLFYFLYCSSDRTLPRQVPSIPGMVESDWRAALARGRRNDGSTGIWA